jgi:phage terminase Nu1 subunit (DNA packaging protein)
MRREPREYFEIKCESQLACLADELEDLEFEADNGDRDDDMELLREIAEIRLHLTAANRKMAQMKAASRLAWPSIRTEMEEILSSLGASIKGILIEREAPLSNKLHLDY